MVLGLPNKLTWEWTSENPVRSVIHPILSSAIPFQLYKWWNTYFGFLTSVSPKEVLIVPRIWMGATSLLVDYLVFKFTYNLSGKKSTAWLASCIFASSYTTWVFMTRTFSNSTETLFFAALLYLTFPKASGLTSKNDVPMGDLKFFWKNVLISLLVVSGFFIRTSFVVFAFTPLCVWVFLNNKSFDIYEIFLKVFLLGSTALLWLTTLILADTLYHNPAYIPNLVDAYRSNVNLTRSLTNLTLTPLNNIMYNTDSKNLQLHGLHPSWTHFVVNFPLLFGPLALVLTHRLVKRLRNGVADTKLLQFCLVCSLIVPLLLLSFIPHQEPRFILPLVVPLCAIAALVYKDPSKHKLLAGAWFVFNIILFFFYGIFHQGGVVPSCGGVNLVIKQHRNPYSTQLPRNCNLTFIYYHTYTPPPHLCDVTTIDPYPLSRACSYEVVDLAGADYVTLERTVRSALKAKSQVYVIHPASIACDDVTRLHERFRTRLKFDFFPHFSSEDPPWRDDENCELDRGGGETSFLENALALMSLQFYRIDEVRTKKAGEDNMLKIATKWHFTEEM